MKHRPSGNQNFAVELQSLAAFNDQGRELRPGEAAPGAILSPGEHGKLPARIRRRLAGLARADLEEAVLSGLAWGNGRGLR